MKTRKTILRIIACLSLSLFNLGAFGQDTAYAIRKLKYYAYAIQNFTNSVPQEKVYLHFDNTSYYQGDHIWFKCYVATSGINWASGVSKTLYVELLNPGGEVIDKRILKLENGQCHGDFVLSRIPFYSGFYEVRAYTKYMLNFGEEAIFSRLLPVFDKPSEEGDFTQKNIQKQVSGKYPMARKKPLKEKKVNLRLFPEGGNMVDGVRSRIAFELTDTYGNPIEATGAIVNEEKEEIVRFASQHEGRGSFSYTPVSGKRKAVVYYKDKKYAFDMPEALSGGYVFEVDNLSDTDSIGITIRSNNVTPDTSYLGLAMIGGNALQYSFLINPADDKDIRFQVPKTESPPGVSRIVLFDSGGNILGDRLVFIPIKESLTIGVKTDKEEYAPYEPVKMEFLVSDKNANPIQTTFSLSVRDGTDEVEYRRNILTDLLLMSEIRGYVRDPSYYFKADDPVRREALDRLLMVQGWRRYSWEWMAGLKPFELKYNPEQGIEMSGKVVSFARQKPKPGLEVSSFLLKRGEENENLGNFMDSFVTDSLGRFSFVYNLQGKWNMILSVSKKGKRKDHRILLDRLFSPPVERYRYADMRIDLSDAEKEEVEETYEEMPDFPEENVDSLLIAYEDSLVKAGIHEKVHRLKEVTVKAKKRTRERDIYDSRSKSIAYYDVPSEWDDIKDKGVYIGNDIHELMINMNKNFTRMFDSMGEHLLYKGKMPLFVIDYKRTMATDLDYNKYKVIRLEAIKSIYISEDISVILRYCDTRISPFVVDKLYSCVVLLEIYPEGKIPVGASKGVRKTWLEGYSPVNTFYSPDYSILPPEPDYRRTLYWNPSVVTNEDGKATVRFHNNSGCRKFSIEAETVTSKGLIGVYKE